MNIKLFPEKKYEFDLSSSNVERLDNLKNETKLSSSLASFKTDKKFIGNFDKDRFNIISSVIGKGAFCVFEGYINETNNNGLLNITVNKAFKILISIWAIFVLSAIIYLISAEGISKALSALFSILVLIAIVRFLLLEKLFNSVSQKGLNDLSIILGITNLRKL